MKLWILQYIIHWSNQIPLDTEICEHIRSLYYVGFFYK